MPAPMKPPPPRMPIFFTRMSATSLGRTAPFSSASLLRKSERIMAPEDGFIRILVNQRASMRRAVSKSTIAPS